MTQNKSKYKSSNISSPKRNSWRMLTDKLAGYAVTIGGMSVIAAITLIFFYLLMVVVPLFEGAEIEKRHEYSISNFASQPKFQPGLHYIIDEQADIAQRINADGSISAFYLDSGKPISTTRLTELAVTSFAYSAASSSIVALGLEDGTAIVAKLGFATRYDENTQRIITPEITYPLGEDPIELDSEGLAIKKIAIQSNEQSISLVSVNQDDLLQLANFTLEESMFEDVSGFEQENYQYEALNFTVEHLLMDNEQRLLFVADNTGAIYFYDISVKDELKLVEKKAVVTNDSKITDVVLAAGSYSLLIAQSDGVISQWFPVRDKSNNYSLEFVRQFDESDVAITSLVPEYFRKGFLSINAQGELGIHHMTAHNTLLQQKITTDNVVNVAISPRADYFLIETAGGAIQVWEIFNEYPEISFSSLWEKVWYEGYEEADYIWQSSSASNDFEPKLSLVPLSFGTIKAALYAMLIAVPLAIFGAIYTAYFMSSALRQTIKPTIEIMEALPTVILGFLAGLWFAPFLETHMPGVFAVSLILPIGILLFAYLWTRLPGTITRFVPDGWQPILLLPVIILIVWMAISISPTLEIMFFGGNMPIWLKEEMGVDYDQRNAMVVGFAMGFAVIPTIFSIAEDSIFSVPKHLTNGSLALGATTWQTLTKVVILTASPGIFSAVMIGFGRAVGETMIVLMATGNTPILDFNIFEGMRTLSANIAVEMPESEVGSTHYRVLFLAALLLFIFTFFFNTIAEVVRHRLRKRYSSL